MKSYFLFPPLLPTTLIPSLFLLPQTKMTDNISFWAAAENGAGVAIRAIRVHGRRTLAHWIDKMIAIWANCGSVFYTAKYEMSDEQTLDLFPNSRLRCEKMFQKKVTWIFLGITGIKDPTFWSYRRIIAFFFWTILFPKFWTVFLMVMMLKDNTRFDLVFKLYVKKSQCSLKEITRIMLDSTRSNDDMINALLLILMTQPGIVTGQKWII